tara:strand:- start:19907 stop:20137 length:231 start_codon:yes stop_codon:yes gene_type:complete
MIVDWLSVRQIQIAGEDTSGTSFEASGIVIPVLVPDSEVAAALSSYDASNQYSPSAADSRAIARIVLDALKKKSEE